MRHGILILAGILVLASASVNAAGKPELSCQDNLRLANELGKEYYDKRDQAEREKIAYKTAFEVEQKVRKSLEAQVAELKKKLGEKEEPKKAE